MNGHPLAVMLKVLWRPMHDYDYLWMYVSYASEYEPIPQQQFMSKSFSLLRWIRWIHRIHSSTGQRSPGEGTPRSFGSFACYGSFGSYELSATWLQKQQLLVLSGVGVLVIYWFTYHFSGVWKALALRFLVSSSFIALIFTELASFLHWGIVRFLKQLYLLAYGFIEGTMAVLWVAGPKPAW